MKKHSAVTLLTRTAILSAVLVLVTTVSAVAATLYVKPGGDYSTIQDAIDASSSGDLILVADGDYRGTGNYDISFGGRDIVVRSENGPANCVVNLTSNTDHRGFIFNNGEGPTALLEGFTIRGAYMFSGASGGGIFVNSASPTIRGNIIKRCTVVGSYTSPGWGMGGGVALFNSSSLFEDNTVDSCTVDGHWTGGGGIMVSGGTPLITGNTISHNRSNGDWPYSDYGGGGICTRYSSPEISDNLIFANRTDPRHDGGGIFCYGNSAPDTVLIVNNVIRDNNGPQASSGGNGGGICTYLSDVIVINNVVKDNAEDGLFGDSRVHVRNTIFDGNVGDEVQPGTLDVTYCWLQGQTYSGAGNINGTSITFLPGPLGDYYYDPLHACNDAGHARATEICWDDGSGKACMNDMTTRLDQGYDVGRVNMGVHYARIPFAIYVPDHFATIQEAIDHALDVDSVCVRAGTYPENITFRGKPIPVFSKSGAAVTTIDGGDAGSVVTFNTGEGAASVLEGFTLTNGHASNGGGIICWATSPTIRNVIMSGNTADIDGGGMYAFNGSPVISGCDFIANIAQAGGGMRCSEASPTIGSSEFSGNEAYHGGGLSCYNSNPHILYTMFTDNIATGFGGGPGSGGGLYLSTGGALHSAAIEYCVFADNEAQNAGGKGGGMLFGSNTYPTLAYCTFYWNTAELGAGILANIGSGTVTNTIVAFNAPGEGVACELGGSVSMSCSDVYNNYGGDWVGCIAGQDAVNHNFSKDPVFCDAYGGDYRVFSQSLCASPFNPSCGQVGAMGVGATPAVYQVNAVGTGDYPTIQAAIDAIKGGQQVELADGVYTGTGNRDIYFWNKSVTVRSASGNPAACVIDCEASSSDTHRGFIINKREGSWAALRGVTVRNAYSAGSGGGMLNQASRPAVSDCVFENCYSTDGGGVFNSAGCVVTMERCTFIGCSATNAGGGLRYSYADGAVIDCVFIDNWANWGGGGLYNYYSGVDVTGSVFAGNTSAHWGGGLHNDRAESSIAVSGCTFDGNGAPSGGAIYNRRDAVITVANTIISNSTQGEAIWCDATSSAALSCSDVYGNAGGDYTGCLAGQGSINNNFSSDPRFCDAGNDDFELASNSPCAPANQPVCGLVGALPVGCGGSRYVVQPDGLGDFPTIAAAVAACADGDTIELTDGSFTGDGNRDINYAGKKIYIRSQSGDPQSCVIDCQANEYEQHRGFIFENGEDRWSILEGVKITNAYVIWLDDGAAIKCRNGSSPTIGNCIFEGNTAGGGAAISCLGGSSPSIFGCTFYRNQNLVAGDIAAMTGSSPKVYHATFFRASPWAITAADDCNVEVFNTIISWTTAGSAVHCFNNGAITLSCSDLYANEGGDWVDGAAGQGTTMNNFSSDPMFCDTTAVELTIHTSSPCCDLNNISCHGVGAWPADCGATAVEEDAVPLANRLEQCYPNPFNPVTTIAYELDSDAMVRLHVYDAAGRLVRVLVDERVAAGRYTVDWNGRNDRGGQVSSGVYFCRIQAGGFADTRKMVLLK